MSDGAIKPLYMISLSAIFSYAGMLFTAKDLLVSFQKIRVAIAMLIVLWNTFPELLAACFAAVSDKKGYYLSGSPVQG
nr:hypothetical protein [Cesiribacter sp. SM1]